MMRPSEADMPGLWEAVERRLNDPSPDFYLAGGPWGVTIKIGAGSGRFALHFPAAWLAKDIAETTKSVMVAAQNASQGGRMSPEESMRCSLAYLVAVSGYAALSVAATRGRA